VIIIHLSRAQAGRQAGLYGSELSTVDSPMRNKNVGWQAANPDDAQAEKWKRLSLYYFLPILTAFMFASKFFFLFSFFLFVFSFLLYWWLADCIKILTFKPRKMLPTQY